MGEEFNIEEWKGKSRKEIEEEIERLSKLEKLYKNETDYFNSIQQALKIGLNQEYGSLVNKYFAMYNQEVGASVTAMGRDVIQYITDKINIWFHTEWQYDKETHEKLGITSEIKKINDDIDLVKYIDTDSVEKNTLIPTEIGKISIENLYNKCITYGSNGETSEGHESVVCPYKVLNYTIDKEIHYTDVKRIIRHKVTKKKWRLKSVSGKEVFVTNDHSLVVFRDGLQLTVKPYEILKCDKILTIIKSMEYIIEDIEIIEECGYFEDEYVYDIEVIDESHTFIANDILVHNSGFILWKPVLDSCDWKGDPVDFILKVYDLRLKDLNKKFLDEYCESYKVKNLHNFALERINYSGLFLAKKMYIQHVAWEEGDEFKKLEYIYPKGIDLVRRTTPLFARTKVMTILNYLFNHPDDYSLKDVQKMLKEIKKQFELTSNIEEICIGTGVSNYNEHVIDDQENLVVVKGSHYSVRAAAYYNHLLYKHSEYKNKYSTIRSGVRCRLYYVKQNSNKDKTTEKFSFPAGSYPKEFAPPIDYNTQFEKTILGPINRFMKAMKLKEFDHTLLLNISLF